MPGKKKSLKKKKKTASTSQKKSHDEEKADGVENVDASTLMSATETPGNATKRKKKGKKRTPRLSRSEKALEKLEKATEKLKEDHIFYDRFINRMHRWLIDIAPKAMELFKKIDMEGEGAVTTDEFKSGMFDLHVPLTRVELHLLTRLLDADNSGEVDYTQLDRGLELARETYTIQRDTEAESEMLVLTRRKFPSCPCCKMSIVEPNQEPYPKFIALELRMVTFDGAKDYPGHFEVLVHSHILVCGLIQIIIEETQIASTKLAIFRDRTRSRESLLPPHLTLRECGFIGDSQNTPEESVLFYDYTVEFTDCPILMCDHYFGKKA
ncbi:hypothetical protein C0Q70_19469 [Pomacea canaliculata]|uniref:EF-hand domain-containing protein n=1 Tax=Pomacea canaliculata TaxID=400727 RepID=A0A2T7NJG1_POMCA|nr:uncharacterized protein LOC112576768 [Pomacea canaliculata]PVD21297.1 hypothetical protein C0Q70_19469 [Pomacea canaliculata]